MDVPMVRDLESTLDALVYERITQRGELKVPRGKFFVRNLFREIGEIHIKGVNRRSVHESIRRLLQQNKLKMWTSTENSGTRNIVRYVHYAPAGIPRGRREAAKVCS